MAAELIEHYVDRTSFASDTEFIKAQIKEAVDSYARLSGLRVGGDGGGIRAQSSAIGSLNKEIERNVTLSNKVAQTEEKLSKARLNDAKAAEAQAKADERVAKAKTTTASAASREEKAIDDLSSDYKQLSKAYNDLALKAKNAYLVLGANHPVTVQLTADAKALGDMLKNADAAVGQHQRNVGNYASGFAGLSGSINQITNELPAFANSMKTGFMAISNNLPIFFDEMKKARAEITRLRESGEKAPSMFKAFTSSLFTWGTALSLGVTALTVFGPQIADFIVSIFKGREALDEFTVRQKAFADTLKSTGDGFQKAVSSVREMRTNIELAKDGFLDKTAVLKEYNETFGDTIGKATDLDEAEKKLIDNGPKYIEMMKLKAAAQGALAEGARLMAEATKLQLDGELGLGDQISAMADNMTFLQKARQILERASGTTSVQTILAENEALRKGVDKKTKEMTADAETAFKAFDRLQKEAAKTLGGAGIVDNKGAKDSAERLRTFVEQSSTKLREFYIEQQKKISEAEALELTTRIGFRKTAYNEERALLDEKTQYELTKAKEALSDVLNDPGASGNARINAQRKYAAEEQKIVSDASQEKKLLEIKYSEDVVAIRGSYAKRQQDIEKQVTEDFKTEMEKRQKEVERYRNAFGELEKTSLDTAQIQQQTELKKQYAAGKISLEAYNREKMKLDNAYRVATLRAEITMLTAIKEARDAAGVDTTQMAAQITNLRAKLDAAISEGLDTTISEKKSLLKSLAGEVATLFASIVNASFENKKNSIQDQIDDINKKRDAEIEAINATSASLQERADRTAVLKTKAQAQTDKLERQSRQVQQQQARFQKALSVAQIGMNTAQAITKQLSATPLPAGAGLVALIAAIGAAQLATVLATPIPRYRMGTDNHPGGLAMVNDGGKREVIVEPGKAPYLQGGWNQTVDLPKGTQVWPDMETFSKMNHRPVYFSKSTSTGLYDASMLQELHGIRHAIENQPIPGVDRMGRPTIRRGNNFTTYIGKNVYN